MPLSLPTPDAITAIHADQTSIFSYVDIFESDGTTIWEQRVPFISGSVSIDRDRDERRTLSLILDNSSGSFRSDPNAFWYDKIIKPYRGVNVLFPTGETEFTYVGALGEFYIDTIEEASFPHQVTVTARDGTKKLLKAKFAVSTEFASGQPIEDVISAIAVNGGIPIDKIDLPVTGLVTTRAFMFDRTTERWYAMREIAEAYNYDLYFNFVGTLVMNLFTDPSDSIASPSEYVFEPGNGTNRNPNPGFETLATGNVHRAAGWTVAYETFGSGSSFDIATTSPAQGERYLSIQNPIHEGASVAGASIPVAEGEEWEISLFAMANQATATGLTCKVVFHNIPDGEWGGLGQIDYALVVDNQGFPDEWEEFSGVVTVPAGANYMRVICMAWGVPFVSYVGYFDDVRAVRLTPLDRQRGNLADFTRVTADARLYNHVVVTGEATGVVPVSAQAENTLATSPTRIERLGRRSFFFTSSFITTEEQAQDVADRFLKIHALEQYEVNVQAIVVPYLDVGIIVDFIDPDPPTTSPVRYLLSSLEIPLNLGTMTGNAKRVTVVG